jgi:hypothetical protein
MEGYRHFVKTKVVGTETLVIDGYADWQTDKYDAADTQLNGIYGRHFAQQLLDSNGLPIYKMGGGQMISRDVSEVQATAEYKQIKRAEINAKCEVQIDKARQDLRRMQDERKIQGQLDKYYNIMKSLIAQRNAELAGVV